MTNPTRSPRPGPLWRTVRRVAALLRWRALWRRGMRWRVFMPEHAQCRCALLPIYGYGVLIQFDDRAALEEDWRAVGADMRSALVDAARAAGPTPTAEDIDAWKQAAADSRQRTEDITRALFGDEHDAE